MLRLRCRLPLWLRLTHRRMPWTGGSATLLLLYGLLFYCPWPLLPAWLGYAYLANGLETIDKIPGYATVARSRA